jgi:hypothetical protein
MIDSVNVLEYLDLLPRLSSHPLLFLRILTMSTTHDLDGHSLTVVISNSLYNQTKNSSP